MQFKFDVLECILVFMFSVLSALSLQTFFVTNCYFFCFAEIWNYYRNAFPRFLQVLKAFSCHTRLLKCHDFFMFSYTFCVQIKYIKLLYL